MLCLAPVTFSPVSHHSGLFFILSGYTSASEIRDLLVFSFLSEPLEHRSAESKCELHSHIPNLVSSYLPAVFLNSFTPCDETLRVF